MQIAVGKNQWTMWITVLLGIGVQILSSSLGWDEEQTRNLLTMVGGIGAVKIAGSSYKNSKGV